MELYLNILHFCFYKIHFKGQIITHKINPFNLIHELPFQKRRYKKLGININKDINRSFGDKRFGFSTIAAGGLLWGLLGVFLFSLLILFNLIIYASTLHLIICTIGSGIICYLFVFKNDKYLEYFNGFETCSRRKKWHYAWLTFGSIISVALLFYIGLVS